MCINTNDLRWKWIDSGGCVSCLRDAGMAELPEISLELILWISSFNVKHLLKGEAFWPQRSSSLSKPLAEAGLCCRGRRRGCESLLPASLPSSHSVRPYAGKGLACDTFKRGHVYRHKGKGKRRHLDAVKVIKCNRLYHHCYHYLLVFLHF